MAVQDSDEDQGPVLNVTEARQASRGRHVAWVLGVSLALIVAGFVGLYLYHLPHLSQPGSQSAVTSSATAAGFQAPPSQPRESENPQTTGAQTGR